MRRTAVLLLVLAGCGGSSGEPRRASGDPARPRGEEIHAYRACDFAPPGELIALPRRVQDEGEPVEAAIREVVGGVTAEERARGCRSHFSLATADAVRSVRRNAAGDTVHVDFRDFSAEISDAPGARSFLPPGVMAELTWTIFRQFGEVDAVHFSFDGDERAFWSWVGEEAEPPRAFTRAMWERI